MKAKCVIFTVAISAVVSFATVKIMSQSVVENAIMKNPKHIITSIENMYKDEKNKSQQEVTEKIPEIMNEIGGNQDMPFIGNENGSKVVIMFYDYACGFCKKQINEIVALVSEDKDVKVLLVDFPIMSPGSVVAAQVGLYINMNNSKSFEKYHIAISKLPSLTVDTIKSTLKKLKLDTSIVEKAQKDEKVKSILEKNYSYSKTLSLQGTPAIIINNKMSPGFMDKNDIVNSLSSK